MNHDNRPTREKLAHCARVTVMGLGLFGGGAGAARYFAELGARVVVTDKADGKKLARSVASLDGLGIVFHLGGHNENDFTDTDLVVANQAVRPDNPFLELARKAGVPIATETGLALGLNRNPWAAVTGSSGKSTTASLLAEMLRHHDSETLFGGNIGGDLLTRIESQAPGSPLIVELSSFQLTYVGEDFAAGRAAPPHVAVMTNLTPNHLDWHRDMEEYADAKFNLFRHQTANDWAVLNLDDPLLARWADMVAARVIRCAHDDPGGPDACFVSDDHIVLRLDSGQALRLPLCEFRLMGQHNVQNALQSVAAAYAMSGDERAVRAGFAQFAGLPHRLEHAATVAGRRFINDSKATTPEASILALASVASPCVLIAGGYDKLSPFTQLGEAIQQQAAGLVLVGAAGQRLLQAVRDAADRRPESMPPLPIVDCGEDFARAVETAFRLASPGGAVLLSPACASYGMFANYEERGDTFKRLAKEMEKKC